MSSQSSGSKRKQPDSSAFSNLLHPGWRTKRAKSGSPSVSGVSTPGTEHSHTPAPSNPESRSPSPMGRPGPSPSNNTLSNAPHARVSPPNRINPIPQPIGASTSTRNSAGGVWIGLEKALQALRITTKICPPLTSAIDDLVSCLPIFEAAAKNRSDYEELATGLKGMVELLIRHLNEATSEEIINAITDIAEAIRKEVDSVNMHQSHGVSRRVLGASNREDDLIRRYRRIEQLFRQLQGEANLGTWSGVNELLLDKRLESLRPAKLARFDSELSTEVSRRGCTKDTRTKILEDTMIWSEDPNMAKMYWMNGMAGTGKTTIAYSLCQRLRAGKQLAASFFCTRASSECREAKRIIPTIAYQLARHLAPFRYCLYQQLKQDPDIATSQLSNQFDLLLKKPLLAAKDKLSNNLVVVVDALDECNDPYVTESFLGLFFRSVAELPIKFFVTSRPEPAIRNTMMPESERSRSILYLHEMEQSLVQADIELYLQEELASISPSDEDIKELAEHAGSLFIYAATAARYIRPVGKAVNSKARLAAILAVSTESTKKLSAIDALYSAILAAAIHDPELEPEEQNQIQLVLWTAVCAYEPILIDTLTALSGLDNRDNTMTALQPLRSVLHVSDQSEFITTLHASFPDYMFAQERSSSFYCDRTTHNQLLAKQCFNIMRDQLRFNICSIQSSYIPDKEIPELEGQISTSISRELFYTCRFWMDHLSEAIPSSELLFLVHEFLSQRLLFWMEVLNLKKFIGFGAINTAKVNEWIARADVGTHTDLISLASDAHKFLVSYAASPATAHTPHIYLSALPLSPPSSSIRSWYLSRFRGLVRVSGKLVENVEEGMMGTWASRSSIRSAIFSRDGHRIILGDEKGWISVQNAYDGKSLVQPFKAHRKRITSIGISSNDMQIVSGSIDMTLSVWNAHDGSLVSGPFKGHTKSITSVAFSPDVTHMASGSDDCVVGIWDPNSVSFPMRSFTGHKKGVKSVAFSPDASCVISGSLDHTIRLWDLSSGVTILTLQGHTAPVLSVQFSPDGAHAVSGSSDHTIRIWSVRYRLPCWEPLKGHSNRITSIAISPSGDRIASGSLDKTIRVWDLHSGKLIAGPFEGHTDSIRSVGFSGDGMRIVSASDDATIRLWNVQDQTSQAKESSNKDYNSADKIIASPDHTHVVIFDSSESPTCHIWDLRTVAPVVVRTGARICHLCLG